VLLGFLVANPQTGARPSRTLLLTAMGRIKPGGVRFAIEEQVEASRIFSATAGEVTVADVFEEPLRGLLNEIYDALETIGSAVVGVRYLPLRGV
jgi:hypothetical protein